MSKELDIAWCAGFFDGEGHVSYRRTYPNESTGKVSAYLACSVPQNSDNREVLDFFQSIVEMGKVCGPYTVRTNGKINHRHELRFNTREVQKLLIILKPYLRSKKTLDFQVALLAYHSHDDTATVEDYDRLEKKKTRSND